MLYLAEANANMFTSIQIVSAVFTHLKMRTLSIINCQAILNSQ